MFEKMIRKARKNEKGFTLVELMVVVVIIGILTAIAIPQFGNVTERAERSAVEGNLRTIEGAIMMYYAEESGWPGSYSDLTEGDSFQLAPEGPAEAEYGIYTFYGANKQPNAYVIGKVGGFNLGGYNSFPGYRLQNLKWDEF